MKLAPAFRYKVGGDACCDFFAQLLRAADPDVPESARVLEIGCAELDWLTIAATSWPSLKLTGIDWRGHKRPPQGATVIQGDVMRHAFPEASFDLIVSISAIEHVGLGHYAQDPRAENGDSRALINGWRWLTPGGWLLFDVPWNAGADAYEVVGSSHRVYDDATVESRLAQGLPWERVWTGAADMKQSAVILTDTPRLKGGERFYYRGFAWRKPA